MDLFAPVPDPVPEPTPVPAPVPDADSLSAYAQRAYLEYALSVVKGRALPDVCDGQKPVQRRILYSMARMGLAYGGANNTVAARPVKSARVVGDVLGRFHPHGDQAAYDALVRMAQDFSQRYPLIDGQGNFGSRDGDGAAAMRYTEARLARITTLLLDEIDEGTVPFAANYDGSTEEPRLLPARLPFTLLNGASGIAVGLATEIPSHNLREIADACVALIKNPLLDETALLALVPGPDYPGGGQIISSAAEIAAAYSSGRGSLRVRARFKIEELARGQWQWVVYELPPGVSTQRVLEEIEDITNPKIKAGKKALSAEQALARQTLLAVLDTVRDESSKDAAVRLVFEPKSSRTPQAELMLTLLAHTSLESSASINMTMIGLDGKPVQKSLGTVLREWIAFRQATVEKRSRYRLDKVLDRTHILEGRQTVLLHIEEVIRLIREADDAKQALIERFSLSERQADDILEIRLRQLARLEALKISQELQTLQTDQQRLQDILDSPASLRRLLVREIENDAKTFADARRTLIQPDKKAVLEAKVPDEPVTVVISNKGWVRTRTGHGHEASGFAFKAGDGLLLVFECRSPDVLLAFGSNGRVYSVPVASLPGGRGDGQPIITLIELEAPSQVLHYFAGPLDAQLLLSSSGGYGFRAQVDSMVSRHRAGKAFIGCAAGESVCQPSQAAGMRSACYSATASTPAADVDASATAVLLTPATHIACASANGRILTFAIEEVKIQPGGGRGLMLIDLEAGDTLAGAAAYSRSVQIEGIGRGGKARVEVLEIRSLNNARGLRGRKGKATEWGFKPTGIVRVL